MLELLVVIAIIAILASLLLSSLSTSKQKAQGTFCMNNLKQMQICWTLYADDSAQVLVPNIGGAEPDYVSNMTWVAGIVYGFPDETNSALLSGSLLGPYTKNVEIYHCPGDPGNPRGTFRVRSISMNNYMHGKGGGTEESDFLNNIRLTDIAHPSSSFVFLDESGVTINDGFFAMGLTTNYAEIYMGDIPACYHGKSAGFSFADGHSILRRWQTEELTDPQVEPGEPLPDNVDYMWMMRNTTVPIGGDWP